MELSKRKKFDNNLLNQLIIRDSALLLGDYEILTQNSIINYKCKCGNNYSKKFRGIFQDGGAFCKECCKINTLEKTKLTYNSEKRKNGYKKSGEKNRLLNNKINLRLKEKYKHIDILNINEYINTTSKLNFKCNICNLEFTRNIRSTINNGCPTCKAKIIKSKIYSTSIYSDTIEKRKENFIKKLENLHPKLYDYSNIKYINKDTKINLKCLKCTHNFSKKPCNWFILYREPMSPARINISDSGVIKVNGSGISLFLYSICKSETIWYSNIIIIIINYIFKNHF